MYRFGEWTDEKLTDDSLQALDAEARIRVASLALCSIDEILHTFDALASLWAPGGEFVASAAPGGPERSADSFHAAQHVLSSLHHLASPRHWQQRLRMELPDPAIISRPVRLTNGVARVFPLGVVQYSFPAGNFLDFVDGLLASLLTRNVPVLVIPQRWKPWASLVLESLLKADGQGRLAGAVAAYPCGSMGDLPSAGRCFDGLVRWPGAGMPTRGDERARVFHRAAPVLVGVISKAFWDSCDQQRLLKTLAGDRELAGDVVMPGLRHIFVERETDLVAELSHVIPLSGESTSPEVSLRPYADREDLGRMLAALPQFATCGIIGLAAYQRDAYADTLGRCGIERLIAVDAFPKRPDCRVSGGLSLAQLVHITLDERDNSVEELLRDVSDSVPYYRERKPVGDVSRLDSWPFLTGDHLGAEPLHSSRKFLHRDVAAGSIFSSGGTSTTPKYALYTPDEGSRSAELLAHGFLANGLRAGDRVINLFIAGHLWSAFLAVDEALRYCGVYVLPMGGLAPIDDIASCLTSFRPNVAFGLPSLLVGYARHCEAAGVDVTIQRIFYAGEHFNASARDYVRRVWKAESFHSAGYAAVDVGPIGWQCTHSQGGEHHLFSRDVHLEIIDDEAVVTSLVRRAMPVVRYRTGDRVEWLSTDCPCGSREPRFRLLGRLDGLMNIWGCRVAYDDVERALVEAGVQSPVRQLILREADDPSAQLEQMVVRLEQTAAGPEFLDRFLAGLYRYSGDLSVALDVGALRKRVVIECVPPGTIPRIARTGKIRPIIDERTSGRV